MLTKEDKEFLTDAFADHKKWAEETFSSKKELKGVHDSVDLVRQKLVRLSLEKSNLEYRLDSIEAATFRNEEKSDRILNILDDFTGKVASLDQEDKMGLIILRRHDAQIHELATATGTAITE